MIAKLSSVEGQQCLSWENQKCIQCYPFQWGQNCSLTCQCEEFCDIDTGICIEDINTDNHIGFLIVLLTVILLVIVVLIVGLVKLGHCDGCLCYLEKNLEERRRLDIENQYYDNEL